MDIHTLVDFCHSCIRRPTCHYEGCILDENLAIVADDIAEEKGFNSKYVSVIVDIVGWKPNPDRPNDGEIPVFKDRNGKIFSNKHLWWASTGAHKLT